MAWLQDAGFITDEQATDYVRRIEAGEAVEIKLASGRGGRTKIHSDKAKVVYAHRLRQAPGDEYDEM